MGNKSTPLRFKKALDKIIADKLPRLDLRQFGLTYIPEEVCSLTFLKDLLIGDIKSKELDVPLGLKSLTSLESLHIHQTQIEELPDAIFEIPNLKLLCLGGNRLSKINPKIAQLQSLVELNLANNAFTEFPKEILQLENLQGIRLSENAISALPSDIANLKHLRQLDLKHNNFKIPREVLSNRPKELIQYILDYQSAKNKRALLEAKLIFIGSGGVGKSSLIQRLTTNKYDSNLPKTDGIEISDWTVKRKRDKIKVHIWDFGGQEIMHATHKFFMTSRSAYVLVVNPRTQDKYGDSELEYWLKLIRSYAGIVPIVVAINKCEVHQMSIAKEELMTKYPNIVGFVETSCEKNIGITDLKKDIEKAIAKLEHIDDKLPETYFDIKNELEKINKDYIEYVDYEILCQKIDPKFKTESKITLVGLLHDLGVMLNFKENRMLKDTQVLNPEWVTQGVYQLINYPNLIKNKGILKASELPKILDNAKYPTQKEQFFITDIMGHFELSFQLEGKPDTYFIPGAFPKDKPSFKWDYNPSNLLRFQYHYDVLPNSIFSRFMVKIHRHIRDKDFWLNGVVMEYENCEALIRADFEEKIISIEVGGAGNRRTLLSIIREKFEDVHSNFKDINIKREIPIDSENKVLVSYDDLLLYESASEETIFIPQAKTRFKVKNLLDGIEEEEARKQKMIDIRKEKGVSVFISYSHQDEVLKDKLKTHLSNLANNNKIRTWDDREIPPGDEWEEDINHFLETSEFILLLISSDFLASKYCISVELKTAIERHNRKDAVVIPISLRACDWSGASFGKIQGLPKDMKAVTSWSNEDEAFTNIAKGISKSIDNYLNRK
jgi:internalin A